MKVTIRDLRPFGVKLALLAAALSVPVPSAVAAAQEPDRLAPEDGYILPPPAVQDVFSRDPNYATLEYLSPDGNHFLVPLSTELSTLERMAEPTYRLGELEVRPGTDRLWHLDTHGIYGLRFFSLAEREYTDVELPDDIFISDLTWSPDGARLAFLAHLEHGTQVWTADVASGRAQRLSDAPVLATLGTSASGQGTRPSRMLQWTPEGTVITLLVPEDRGPEPAPPAVPESPLIRRTPDEPLSTRTLPYLLEDGHDATLFEHYARSQLAELSPGEPPRLIGEPAMVQSISLSPDGRHILARTVERPFSFRQSWTRFPRRTVAMERSGEILATLEYRPLDDGGEAETDSVVSRRELSWRPDGSGLVYLERVGGEEDPAADDPAADDDVDADDPPAAQEDERDDRIMLLPPPFDTTEAVEVARSPDPIRSLTFTLDGRHAVAWVARDDERALAHFDFTGTEAERRIALDFHEPSDDPTEAIGELLTLETSNGIAYGLVSSDEAAAYLEGPGFKEDFRPQPFVDRVELDGSGTTRIFEGSPDFFDQPLLPLDPELNRLIVSRESSTQFPDSYLWTRDDASMVNLTNNVDPFPEVTAAQRIDFEFARRDGVQVQARISLPIGYEEGTKVPAVFWTYPREYNTPEEYEWAAIRARNRNAFHHMTWLRWSDIWLTQGYAVVYPDIPIVGENYNDNYIANLVDAMYAAIRAVDDLGYVDIDRIGHGGHSYGAFTTVNLLAHSPFFKAGIAGDGAYNRTLTPSGFQSERRSLWEAPHTYMAISPFFYAHQVETPLLLYHGADDNNTGTWPMQSDRLIHALTTLGKDAVLYKYPFESHTPRAIENNLDMWARWLDWFDWYVKGEGEVGEVVDGS